MAGRGNVFRLGLGAAGVGALVGLSTLFGAGRSLRHGAVVPLVASRSNVFRLGLSAAGVGALVGLGALFRAGRGLRHRAVIPLVAGRCDFSGFLVGAARALAGAGLLALRGAGRRFGLRPRAQVVAELGNGLRLGLAAAVRALIHRGAIFLAGRGCRRIDNPVVVERRDGLRLSRAAGRALIGLDARFAAGRRRRYRAIVPGVFAGRCGLPRLLVGAAGALAGTGLFALCAAGRSFRHRPRVQVVAKLGNGLRLGSAAAVRALIHRGAVLLTGRRCSRINDPVVVERRDGLGFGRATGRALIGLDARFSAGRRRRYRAIVPGVFAGRCGLPRFLVGAAGALAGTGLFALRAAGRGLRHRPRAHVVAELGDGLGLGLGAAGLGALIHRGAVRFARRSRGRPGVPDVVMGREQHLDRSAGSSKGDVVLGEIINIVFLIGD